MKSNSFSLTLPNYVDRLVTEDVVLLKNFLLGKNDVFPIVSDISTYKSVSKIFSSTNERIKNIKNYDLKNKKCLCVTSSGDQILHLIYEGASDITAFDINIFCKYYANLKIAMVKAYNFQNFRSNINKLTDDLAKTFDENKEYLQFLNKIITIDLKDYLDSDTIIFWKNYYRIKKYNKKQDNELLFRKFKTALCNNLWFNSEDDYLKLKSNLINANINFIDSNITSLNKILLGKYDFIYTSNIISSTRNKDDVNKSILYMYSLLNNEGILLLYGLSSGIIDLLDKRMFNYFDVDEYAIIDENATIEEYYGNHRVTEFKRK